MSEALQAAVAQVRGSMLSAPVSNDPSTFVDPQRDYWTVREEKKAREAATTAGDYWTAISREDSPVAGLVHSAVGTRYAPDPNYTPHDPKEWEELTKDIPLDYHEAFNDAVSKQHALYIKDFLYDKLRHMEHLGDLDGMGTAARIGFGLIEPTNLSLGLVSGGAVSLALKGKQLAAAGKALAAARATGTTTEASLAAAKVSALAGVQAGKTGVAAGILSGAGANVAWEKLRQEFNYEDDKGALLEAALIGAGFSTPFALLSARNMAKLSKAAGAEREVLGFVQKVNAGENLKPHEEVRLTAYLDRLKELEEIHRTGSIEAEFKAAKTGLDDAFYAGEQETLRGFRLKQERAQEMRANLRERTKDFEERYRGDYQKLKQASEAEAAKLIDEINTARGTQPTNMELAFMRAQVKQKMSRAREYDQALKQAEAQKAKELDQIWADGHMAKADEPAPPRQAPDTPETTPRMAPEDPVGREVMWEDEYGDMVVGLVDDVAPDGRYIITESSSGEMLQKRASELHKDSQLYEADIPEGFMRGSVGAAQIGDVPTQNISPDVDELTEKSRVRWDFFATLNRSQNAKVRELGHLLFKDAIGNSKEWAQGWTAGELKRTLVRRLGGQFHLANKQAFNELAKAKGWNFFNKYKHQADFHERVSILKRGDQSALTGDAAYDAALQKSVAASHKLFSEMATELKTAGVVGSENLQIDPNFVPRVWKHPKLAEVGKRLGDDVLERLIAKAIRVPGMPAAERGTVASGFLSAVRKLQYKAPMIDIMLQGHDMGALRAELDKHGLTQAEQNGIVNLMFEVHGGDPDAGKPGNLRHRFLLDETESVTVNGEKISLSSLLENDIRLLSDRYMSTMAGHVAMAKQGFHSQAEWNQAVKEAVALQETQFPHDSPDQFNRELQLVQDGYAHITGRPMSTQEFNRQARVLAAARAWTRASTLGNLGISAAFEMWNAVALGTSKAFWQQIPSFRKMVQAVRHGYIPDDLLAQDMMHMGGWGTEMSAAYARQSEITDFTYDQGLTRFESWGNRAAHAVDAMSGNASFTSATRMLTAMTMAQKHYNFAVGKATMSESIKTRLVHQGINRGDIDAVLADLKKFSKADPRGTLEEIDWENWQQQSRKTYDAYTLMSQREVRDAIQDHDLGETMPWMHTTVGKVISELRVFNLVSHSKQFLKGLTYHDRMTAMQWTLGFMGQSMAYMVQTSLNFAHNPEELERRLTLERIGKAAVARMSSLGMLPYAIDTGSVILGGEQFLKGSSANTENRNLFVTPSMMQMNRIYNGVKTITNAVNPLSDTVTTKKEMKDVIGMLPGGNLWGIRNLADAVSDGLPKGEPRVAPQ